MEIENARTCLDEHMDDAFTITILTTRHKALGIGVRLKESGIDNFHIDEVPGKKICKRCEGTGNQLLSMYQKCEACNGTGVI